MICLDNYQIDAVKRLKNGCILCGGVGSGKSLTALAYYYLKNDGVIESLMGNDYVPMSDPPKNLYIITTAKKRDSLEWEGELSHFLMSVHPDTNLYQNKIVVDSWNNIKKYSDISNGFFIFDEQRLIGNGAWVKSFYKIAKNNEWILLSATPGDTWGDYIPVFIANGFYKNRTAFLKEHAVYAKFVKYPKIDRYIGTGKLMRFRKQILINMEYKNQTISHHEVISASYNSVEYKSAMKDRWNPFKNEPIINAGELCYTLRKIVNSDYSRQLAFLELCEKRHRIIVFYNFDYELEILKNLKYPKDTIIAEWNGHRHESIPHNDRWVYLVQYTAGCEGWNCIDTDTIVFYSQNYSYKVMIQAAGRIDRRNTPFKDLYYYHFKSRAPIDLGISRSLKEKKNFNEQKFTRW